MFKKILLFFLLLSAVLNATSPTEENVAKLYIASFDRTPDAAGLEYWMDSGFSLEEIAASFFEQEEMMKRYPEMFSDKSFILAVYRNVFDRYPKSSGLEYWTERLSNGAISRTLFILAVINGAWGDDAMLIDR